MNVAYNIDCMEYMKTIPDKYFELAIVDPPYGGGSEANEYKGAIDGRFGGRFEKYIKAERTGGTWAAKYGKNIAKWDKAPSPEYFEELRRVSKDQIVWGGNYFDLPPTRCFLIWRKTNIPLEGFTMSPCEYAWTSFNRNAGMCEAYSSGGSGREERFHPTQKPVALYEWLLTHYAKQGDKILDTHLGSGSSRIAAYDLGFDFVGCEIDEDYFKAQEERFAAHTDQQSLFIGGVQNG